MMDMMLRRITRAEISPLFPLLAVEYSHSSIDTNIATQPTRAVFNTNAGPIRVEVNRFFTPRELVSAAVSALFALELASQSVANECVPPYRFAQPDLQDGVL